MEDVEITKNGDEAAAIGEESVEDQQTRCLLRERFLRFISNLSGQSCRMNLFESSQQTCTIKACDAFFDNIIVENLSTNYQQIVASAIIRTGDIISIEFEVDDLSRYS